MDKRRAVESGIRRKELQSMQYSDRYGSRSSIFRSNSPPASPPPSSQISSPASPPPSSPASSSTSSFIRPISSVQVGRRLAQLKQMPAQLSCSIVRYPYAWLGATWLGLVLIGSVATVALLRIDPTNPEPSIAASPVDHALSTASPDDGQMFSSPEGLSQEDLRSAQGKAAVPELAPIPSKRSSSLPLFALGTVAFSCAIGCLLLSYRFGAQAPKTHSRLPTQSQRLPRSASAAPALPKGAIPKGAAQPREATQAELRSSKAEASDETSVAIVSSDESHPLDWDEPSLADNLDIRQRHPLSHWL